MKGASPSRKKGKRARGALARYEPICDAIALLFQPHVEVVLHEIKSDSVVYIAGNFSKRVLGEPSLLQEEEYTGELDVVGPYEKINWDGRKLKSITSVLRDDEGVPLGLLCINADLSEFQAIVNTLSALVRIPVSKEKPEALFKDDWHERINEYVQEWTHSQGTTVAKMSNDHRRQLVIELSQHGAFGGRNAASYISRVLGLGRATVYKYLKEQA